MHSGSSMLAGEKEEEEEEEEEEEHISEMGKRKRAM